MRLVPAFHEVVMQLSGHAVVPVNDNHVILDVLSGGLDTLLTKSKYTLYKYKRINEVGKSLEGEILDILDKNSEIETVPVGQHVGYPDMCARTGGTFTYLEVKVTGVLEGETDTQRRFYMSSGKKIKHDGHHLLVLLYLEAEGAGFRLRSWRINDLYNLQVGIKKEYNASSRDFAMLRTLRHS
ncbi:MAG: hypothetical protein OXL96_18620 [Candidatus Poribacteria bacterium]|nr:hypothetical protein [Candidatus Poribacteria bacterium]